MFYGISFPANRASGIGGDESARRGGLADLAAVVPSEMISHQLFLSELLRLSVGLSVGKVLADLTS